MSSNIIPKDCSYQCGTRIYWNTSENAYFEVVSNKKHVCPNRPNKTIITNNNTNNSSVNRPFYSKNKVGLPKPKMSNSLELLQGPIQEIQKKYEILSDIVINEYQGKVHGSQSNVMHDNSISIVVYYEIPEGKREEVKQKFNNYTRNIVALQRN